LSDQTPDATPEPVVPEAAAEAVAEAPAAAEAVADAPAAAEAAAEGVVADAVPAAPAAPAVPPPPAMPVAPVVGAASVPVFPNGKPMLDAAGNPVSDKSRLAAALLCWFVGIFGVHRFYVGKVGTGILMLVTLGALGIWALIDLIVILLGSFRDKSGKALQNW
jgi:TM2 domain-containing membrane protein YozV